MALDQEAIAEQLTLLAAHRRTLAHLLQQAAQFGGEVFAPPQTAAGIDAARGEIQRIKAVLREGGVQVQDEPNDEAPPQAEPVQRSGGDVVSGDKVAGDKVGGDKVMGDKRTINTGGGDYAEGDIDKRQGTFIGEQHNYYQPALTPLDRQQRRNRQAMLAKVKAIWIDGLLEQSLAKELRIALGLTEHPDAVDLPLNVLVQELRRSPRELSAGTPIIRVFEQMGGAMLILGAPGAGKTTLLLELARDLIARAEQDEGHPIPVVFNLSSWATKRRPLKEWLVEELNEKYDVPRKLAQAWMDVDVVLPLLDGLDEVAEAHRERCVEAINNFRQKDDGGLVPIVICSRSKEYKALTIKLHLQSAIVVHMLSGQQADNYLERAGEKAAGIRTALREDVKLKRMLRTPLMLSIAMLAYAGTSTAELHITGTAKSWRQQLFDDYITAMFVRRSKETRFTQQQTTRWLSWLAGRMATHSLTVYYIERMQPDWLRPEQQRRYLLRVRLLVGLAFGLGYGLVLGLRVVPAIGLLGGLGFGLVAGLLTTLLGTPLVAMVASFDKIKVTEMFHWSWSHHRLFFGLGCGLFFGLSFGLIYGLVGGLLGGLGFGLVAGLLGSFAIIKVTEMLPWSSRNRLVIGLRSGLSGGLGFGLVAGLRSGLLFGLLFGLAFGLVGGLGIELGGGLEKIEVPKMLSWVPSFRRQVARPILNLVYALFVGLVYGLVFRLRGEQVGGLSGGLVFGLLGGLVFGLLSGLSGGELKVKATPNQGIHRSARSLLLVGLTGGSLIGLLIGLVDGLWSGLVSGLEGGLLGGLLYGGATVLQHYILRWLLYRNGSLPLRLIPFLDYCAERIFLRKVGGGYIFVHRLLMEHFASLYTGEPTAEPVEAKQTTP